MGHIGTRHDGKLYLELFEPRPEFFWTRQKCGIWKINCGLIASLWVCSDDCADD
jgi:hypothetical protein